jgi:sulfur-oxidizing protein SoxX
LSHCSPVSGGKQFLGSFGKRGSSQHPIEEDIMRIALGKAAVAASLAIAAGGFAAPAVLAQDMSKGIQVAAAHGGMDKKEETPAQKGKKVAENRSTGNCVACHAYQGAESPGAVGPPLVAMKARYPDKAALRAQIWDATAKNPNSLMPPFGKHLILTEQEIDQVTEWAHGL